MHASVRRAFNLIVGSPGSGATVVGRHVAAVASSARTRRPHVASSVVSTSRADGDSLGDLSAELPVIRAPQHDSVDEAKGATLNERIGERCHDPEREERRGGEQVGAAVERAPGEHGVRIDERRGE